MSIEKTGVRAYEYQYLATLYIGLIIADYDEAELFVEPPGSEDALITININGFKRKIEVQVKSDKGALDFNKLVGWLLHFQNRKTDNNLLSRLIEQNETSTLFISNARCKDSLVFLKNTPPDLAMHESVALHKTFIPVLNAAIKKNYSTFKENRLGKGRKDFCIKLSELLSKTNSYNQVLEKVIVWEEISSECLQNLTFAILNKKYKIPNSQTNRIIQKLLRAVKTGRDSEVNIMPLFRETLATFKPLSPKITKVYFSLEEKEKQLISYLEKESGLLLTGLTFCGKTELAKIASKHFYKKGFDYLISSEVGKIETFFIQNPSDDKIAILEDPWGHIEPIKDSLDQWRRVRVILDNLPNNHKLIITSRYEIIKRMDNQFGNKLEGISEYSWFDLTITDLDTLCAFWDFVASKGKVKNEVRKTVADLIKMQNDKPYLQIGHLLRLAKSNIQAKHISSLDNLLHFARQNSAELANNIITNTPELVDYLAVLSLNANTINGILIRDLEQIFSSENKTYSILDSVHKGGFFFGEFSPEYPKYENLPENCDLLKSLELLEEKGYIDLFGEKIFFSHPAYFEMGRYLFLKAKTIRMRKILALYKRSFNVINNESTAFAAKSIHFFFENLPALFKDTIIDLAFYALKSIYPAVSDQAQVFLTKEFKYLSQDKRGKIIQLHQYGGTDHSCVFWFNKSIPFISNEGANYIENEFRNVNKNESLQTISDLSDVIFPNQYRIWSFLIYWGKNKGLRLQPVILEGLLSYDESFIRGRVAYLVLKNLRINYYSKILRMIFGDDHSSVTYSALRGAIAGWNEYSLKIRKLVKPYLKSSLKNTELCIRACRLMTTFGIDYTLESVPWYELAINEKKNLWNLWGELFPIFYKKLPVEVFINSGRLSVSMDDAVKYLTLNNGIKVLSAWFEIIDLRIKHGKHLDDYFMAIADNLMMLTKKNSKIRKTLFSKLVSYPKTSFLLCSLKWILSHWENLNNAEKNQILSLIDSKRKDKRWLVAVMVASANPPVELLKKVFNDGTFFKRKIDEIFEKFPKQLLADCLNVFCGFPQPLGILAFDHKNIDFWKELILHINLKSNDKPVGLKVCVRELVYRSFLGDRFLWKDRISESTWMVLCFSAEGDFKKFLFSELLKWSININQARSEKFWTIFFDSIYEKEEKSFYCQKLAENVEAIENSFYTSIYKVIGKKLFLHDVINFFPNDKEIIEQLIKIKSKALTTSSEDFIQLRESLAQKHPATRAVREIVVAFFKPYGIKLDLKIDDIPEDFLSKDRKDFIDEYELENWIW